LSGTYSHLVGIGASAGGTAAIEQLLDELRPGDGMAYVIIPHLQAGFDSGLDQILRRRCPLPVVRIEDGTLPCADHVYTLTRKHLVVMADGRLSLRDQPLHTLPIDPFFVSLATAIEGRAVGIVLSGTGRDGAAGLEAIHRHGGLTIAQEPRSARFGDMPRAALATGLVDACLSPRNIPELLRFYAISGKTAAKLRPQVSLPGSHPPPRETAPSPFFTPEHLFARLQQEIIPGLLRRPCSSALRMLCCGDDQGEMTYSLAILVHEQANATAFAGRLEFFAGAGDPKTLQQIAAGLYSIQQVRGIDSPLLQRYFLPSDNGHVRVHADLRRLVVPVLCDHRKPVLPSGCDLIVYRAVTSPAGAHSLERTVALLQKTLLPHGFLVLDCPPRTVRLFGREREFISLPADCDTSS